MRICVLGAGVIGVSTAYALARLGHEIIVIDKGKDVATGASQANGAQLSYSYVDPLASPSTLKKMPSYLLGLDKALQLKFRPDLHYFRWGLCFLKNCSPSLYKSNRLERQALADLSRDALESFEKDMPERFMPTGRGKLILSQTRAEYNTMKKEVGFVGPESCLELEPSLKAWARPILGGIYSMTDYALNTVDYCKALKTSAEEKFGVQYCFGEKVSKLISRNGRVSAIETDKKQHLADKFIICLGNDALPLLKPLDITLPIYPIQGYSLTLRSKESSPCISVTDLQNKIVYANLGDKFRIAGFVDVNQRFENNDRRLDLLLQIARETWPDVADFDGPIEKWTGARPMIPSGVPIIGESKVEGLYLNLGHGSLGYTFAAGSAMKIANIIGHKHKNIGPVRGNHNAA